MTKKGKRGAKYRTFNTSGLCFHEKHYMVEIVYNGKKITMVGL